MFKWLSETAQLSQHELLKTFNAGIGMIAVVDADKAEALTALLTAEGETVYTLGTITTGGGVTYEGALV